MASQWFKFYGQEFLSDPKMLGLSPIDRSLWLTLLCLGSSAEEEGKIKYINEQKIMTLSGLDPMKDEWNESEGFLKRLEKLNMITVDNETIVIKNWEKRQQRAMTPYERVKKYREIHKNEAIDNGMITVDNGHDNDRIDKNRIEENRIDDISERNIRRDSMKEKQKLSTDVDRNLQNPF